MEDDCVNDLGLLTLNQMLRKCSWETSEFEFIPQMLKDKSKLIGNQRN